MKIIPPQLLLLEVKIFKNAPHVTKKTKSANYSVIKTRPC